MHEGEIAFGPGEEFRVIRRLIRRLGPLASGIGDDAALVHVPRDNALAISTDTSLENVHFRREWLSLHEIAYRAAIAALSDLAAMGASGAGLLVALTVPALSRAELDELGDGIAEAVRAADARVVGGDTTRGDALALTFTVFGTTRDALHRHAARAGHRVYVTGRLGGAGAALRALLDGEVPRPEWRERFAHPMVRLREARWLAGRGARAAIDISDGLIADAGHVAAASHVKMDLDLDRVPVVDGVSFVDAARSGEEYELLVTSAIPLDTSAFTDRFGVPLTEIGIVKDGQPGVRALLQGRPMSLEHGGFDHFART